jgi:hypothetical protein
MPQQTSKKKSYMGFSKLVAKIEAEGKSEESAKAIAASVGRKKYGKKKFQKAAAEGKSLKNAKPLKK